MTNLLEQLNVIEIGRPYLKYSLPKTRCFASRQTSSRHGTEFEPLSKLPQALRDKNVDLVVCHPQYSAPWSLAWWLRHIGHRNFRKGYLPVTSLIAPHLLRLGSAQPIAIIDLEDTRFIQRCDFFLLDRCTAWFKRELPADRWQVMMKTDHPNLPSLRYRRTPRNRARIAKLHPLPLGFKFGMNGLFPEQPIAKTVDIFWAGTIEGSSFIREQGMKQLKHLRNQGYRVDIVETSIPQAEFFRRAAAAYLVWSPEGYGWDCFRHYEAPMCWSIPVMNRPTIERHAPLIEGRHAFYYDTDDASLIKVMEGALRDRDRLLNMAAEARLHVIKYHQPASIASYIVETTLQAKPQ